MKLETITTKRKIFKKIPRIFQKKEKKKRELTENEKRKRERKKKHYEDRGSEATRKNERQGGGRKEQTGGGGGRRGEGEGREKFLETPDASFPSASLAVYLCLREGISRAKQAV